MIASLKYIYNYLTLDNVDHTCLIDSTIVSISTDTFSDMTTLNITNNYSNKIKLDIKTRRDTTSNMSIENFDVDEIASIIKISDSDTTCIIYKPLYTSYIKYIYQSNDDHNDRYIVPCQYISCQDFIMVHNKNVSTWRYDTNDQVDTIKIVASDIYKNLDIGKCYVNPIDNYSTSLFMFNNFTLTTNIIFNLFTSNLGIQTNIGDYSTYLSDETYLESNMLDIDHDYTSTNMSLNVDKFIISNIGANYQYNNVADTNMTIIDTSSYFDNQYIIAVNVENYVIERYINVPHIYYGTDFVQEYSSHTQYDYIANRRNELYLRFSNYHEVIEL